MGEQIATCLSPINKVYYNTVLVTTGVYIINIGMTIRMIENNYHSSSTLSCFASFSLLVMMKLYNSLNVAYESVKNDKMMSAYMSEFVSFNVLDQDYVDEKYKGAKNNRLEDINDLEDNKKHTDTCNCVGDVDCIKEDEIVPIIPNQ